MTTMCPLQVVVEFQQVSLPQEPVHPSQPECAPACLPACEVACVESHPLTVVQVRVFEVLRIGISLARIVL